MRTFAAAKSAMQMLYLAMSKSSFTRPALARAVQRLLRFCLSSLLCYSKSCG